MTDDRHDNGYEDTGEIVSGVAALAYDDWEPTEVPCVACGGDLVHLGTLGKTDWYRCRHCGIDQPL